MMTKWNNCLSTRFSVTNGVKQGGVLSPLLFIIYFDEMISRLKNSGIGCTISGKFIGALCYADDLTLLSPSINGLSSMIRTCEAFANEYNVVFNQKKPVGIQFGRTSSYTINGVTLNGCLIDWCTKVKHLGNVVNSRLTDNDDCKNKRSILIGNVNRFIGSYNALSVSTKCKLYKAYCSNSYGSELWQCNSRGFKMCCTEWRKATRRIFNLPYMAHSYILGPLCGQSSINETLYRRMLNFIHSVILSSNDTVAYIGQLALRSALTPLGYKISYLRETFEIDFARSGKQNMSILKKSNWLSDHQLNNVTMGIELHEMLDVHPCAFTRPEVYQMLDYVCTV